MIENGAIITKKWRVGVSETLVWILKALLRFLAFFCIYPLVIPPAIAGILWFFSLGHLNFWSISTKPIAKTADYVFGD